jgi:prephenate dehydratase
MLRVTRQKLPFARKIKQSNHLPPAPLHAEDRLKIAIQGELGSFSHQAALQFAADAHMVPDAQVVPDTKVVPDVQVVPCRLSRQVFRCVLDGELEALAVPLENTLAGAVVEHYDLMREHRVFIHAETVVRIEHHLIGVPGARISDLRRVYSHPVALAQCKRFFREHPEIEATAFYDTAGAAAHIVRAADPGAAALASRQAATLYGGALLAEGVEDDPANYTRFVLARRTADSGPPQAMHKLSLCIELDRGPGSLLALLAAVAELQGNVTQLQPRPIAGQPWQYCFFLDALLPHAAATQRLLEQLPALCTRHRMLGHYPAAPEFLELLPFGW